MENSYRFFENRACQYFPCHKLEGDFNCLFCYCPLYNRKHCPGNHTYIEKNGRQIKVCTDCTCAARRVGSSPTFRIQTEMRW